jgi:glutamate synthase (NADPH/NADH) small chain
MPEQPAEERRRNFNEVALGYEEATARAEAARCLQCKTAPCRQGCPVEINIPQFIKHIKEGDFDAAIDEIKTKNNLPAVCGRVCPQEDQCEKYCVMGKKGEPVGIGRLERFAADYAMAKGREDKAEVPAAVLGKVAVIGAGPAGLTAAGDLARMGYKVTVFEALHAAGGVLMYGIPEFRLPKAIVQKEIDALRKLGVDIQVNAVIGKTYTIDELLNEEGYDAVFIGTGGLPQFWISPGKLQRCLLGQRVPHPRQPDKVTNIRRRHPGDRPPRGGDGGGNVAKDSARTALSWGAEKFISSTALHG